MVHKCVYLYQYKSSWHYVNIYPNRLPYHATTYNKVSDHRVIEENKYTQHETHHFIISSLG